MGGDQIVKMKDPTPDSHFVEEMRNLNQSDSFR